ncbi:PREDICTED: uncharacterized protein LOC105359057 [Ceratosolen solmsi marchali]|uniref:Uncharacterized protein LOC105359057 n=1 Tax=Ceratosolen solmsi marchali TaxID=326594 RepID=A0AAJ6VIH4_9HYME|nr:PREDICTED: uncharacterized protein LOC105359057 [Ceratosolen solmsi marchali]
MQSDVPPLPISCLTTNIRVYRNSNLTPELTAQESTLNPFYKSRQSALLASNKKKLCPIIAESSPSPYKNSAHFNPPDIAKSPRKSVIRQRISSAKMLRIKQLQNQLADAHFHLNELSNENKLLKVIQKRQDTALKRYEGTNAELPRIIHSHHEDLRVLQTKFKKLKCQYKETSDVLKDKENELHSLQIQNKKLLQLSKDRQLREREKLQTQVLDLNHRIDQQDEIIQTLKRKLALESKYLKHQLHKEILKHKETQKQLQDTQFKLKTLEELTEQRERKSYQSSRIAFFNKNRSTTTSQSLTNLSESRSENLIKAQSFRRRSSETATGQSLPALHGATLLSGSRFQNSHKLAPFSIPKSNIRDSPIKESRLEEIDITDSQVDLYLGLEDVKKISELPKALKQEFHYPSHDDSRDEDDILHKLDISQSSNFTNGSRLLYTRFHSYKILVNSAADDIRTSNMETTNGSLSLSKDNNSDIENKEIKCDHDSVVTVVSKVLLKADVDVTRGYSNSNLESQIEIPIDLNIGKDRIEEKSDIDIGNLELKKIKTPSNLSKLLNKVDQYYNNSLDCIEGNDLSKLNLAVDNDEIKLTSLSSSLIDYHPADDAQDQLSKNSIEYSKATLSSYIYKNDNSKVNETKFVGNEAINGSNAENNSSNSEQIFDITEDNNSQESKKYVKHYDSNGKAKHNHLEKLKNKTERKTAEENTKIFDKAKLLAAMKAIDDNENVEFINKKIQRNSMINQFKIAENLYSNVPAHSRKKSDIMNEIFSDTKLDNNKNSNEY